MSNDTLTNIGLTEYESKIYELLLKMGEIPMAYLIKESQLKHSTVYSTVESLVKKRLVTQKDIKKKLHVKAESPAKLLDIARNQFNSANSTLSSMQSMLPSFLTLYINSTTKPAVRVFEGMEGVKQVYQDILNEGKFVYSLVKVGAANKELSHWIDNFYTKKRIASNMHTNVIASNVSSGREFKAKDIKELRSSRIISQSSFPLDIEINIYGDKVALIYQANEYPLLGIVINHPMISSSFKSWFDLAWVGAAKS